MSVGIEGPAENMAGNGAKAVVMVVNVKGNGGNEVKLGLDARWK